MTSPNILVTGSSRGIGAATATLLRQRGAEVFGQATRPVDAATIVADFAETPAPHLLWEQALDRCGGQIDVLVNNAGIFVENPLDSSDIAWLDGWEDTLRINLTAAAQLSRFAVRHWQQRGAPGRIVHVAS
ncbi:MAG: SDR family oxidoreductase, partial [Croceibacterium sp.]